MGAKIKSYKPAYARGLQSIQFSGETYELVWSDFLWWQNDDNDVKTCANVISCSHAIGPDGTHHLTIFYTNSFS